VGDWKIVAAGKNAAWELYNLRDDRSESRNLAGDRPEIAGAMAERWRRELEDYSATARKDVPPSGK
jgi:arylsulfatase